MAPIRQRLGVLRQRFRVFFDRYLRTEIYGVMFATQIVNLLTLLHPPWWVLPIAWACGFVAIYPFMAGALTGQFYWHPRHWVRSSGAATAYLFIEDTTQFNALAEWCRDHCRGAWVIDRRLSLIHCNRTSDMAMLKLSHFKIMTLDLTSPRRP